MLSTNHAWLNVSVLTSLSLRMFAASCWCCRTLWLFLITLQSVVTCEGVIILMRQSCLVSTVDGDTLLLQMVQAYLGCSGSVQGERGPTPEAGRQNPWRQQHTTWQNQRVSRLTLSSHFQCYSSLGNLQIVLFSANENSLMCVGLSVPVTPPSKN